MCCVLSVYVSMFVLLAFFVGRDVLACFCCCLWFPFFVCVVCLIYFFYNGVWIVVVLFQCCASLFVLCV